MIGPFALNLERESENVRRLDNNRGGISHLTALELLLASMANERFDDATLRQLPAIVSHWLQSPHENPVIIESKYGRLWRGILSSYSNNRFVATNGRRGTFLRFNRRGNAAMAKSVKIDFVDVRFPPTRKPKFTFIDLFAGVGGFRVALQDLDGKCVFSSEFNQSAAETYLNNFGEIPFGDITQFTPKDGPKSFRDAIPEHNVLAAGFPCQPFSQAGHQRGFADTRGTLFFNILEIIRNLGRERAPDALILENVKRFRTHDGGNTHRVVVESLRQENYKVYSKILRAHDYGVAQNRERIFIVAFKRPLVFEYPKPVSESNRLHTRVRDAFEDSEESHDYVITKKMWEGHRSRKANHQARGNGFGYTLFSGDERYANTISARYYKDGSEILIKLRGADTPRVLMPEECANLQGFPRAFKTHPSDKEAWQQFGNSVAVPVVRAVAVQVLAALKANRTDRSCLDPFEPVIL